MRYATKRRIQNWIVIGMLALGYIVATTAQAEEPCPALPAGIYSVDAVPYQSAGCGMTLNSVGPESLIGSMQCPGSPSASDVTVLAPLTPNAEGICTATVRVTHGHILIPEDAPDQWVAVNGSWRAVGISDPDAACLATDHWYVNIDPTHIEAVNVTPRPDDNGVDFICEVTGMHALGFTTTAQSSVFNIYEESVTGYQPATMVVEGTGQTWVYDGGATVWAPETLIETLGGSPTLGGQLMLRHVTPPL